MQRLTLLARPTAMANTAGHVQYLGIVTDPMSAGLVEKCAQVNRLQFARAASLLRAGHDLHVPEHWSVKHTRTKDDQKQKVMKLSYKGVNALGRGIAKSRTAVPVSELEAILDHIDREIASLTAASAICPSQEQLQSRQQGSSK